MVEAVVFLLILGTIIYVGLPLFRSKTAHKIRSLQQLQKQRAEGLLTRKDTIYSTLKDLDFDYKMGKLSEQDYEELKTQYEKEAVSLLQKIDELDNRSLLDQQLEAEISEYKEAVKRKGAGKEQGNYCPQCGHQYAAEDKFCSHCGTRLNR